MLKILKKFILLWIFGRKYSKVYIYRKKINLNIIFYLDEFEEAGARYFEKIIIIFICFM